LLPHAFVNGQLCPVLASSASPLVYRPAPVVPRIVEAAGRNLDQALVETRVGAFAIGRPLALPDLVGIPVATVVKKLDPLRQERRHRNNRVVDEARSEYSRVNLSADPIYRYLRITKGGPGGVAGQAAEQDLV